MEESDVRDQNVLVSRRFCRLLNLRNPSFGLFPSFQYSSFGF